MGIGCGWKFGAPGHYSSFSPSVFFLFGLSSKILQEALLVTALVLQFLEFALGFQRPLV